HDLFVRLARDRLGPDGWDGSERTSRVAQVQPAGQRGDLPAQPTLLIGREAELGEATALFRQDRVCLLVLTGPPGVGKTHLSLRLAAGLSADFVNGVVFVPLVQIIDHRLVGSAIAQALGVAEIGARPVLESVRDQLRDAYLLLVLDNFE